METFGLHFFCLSPDIGACAQVPDEEAPSVYIPLPPFFKGGEGVLAKYTVVHPPDPQLGLQKVKAFPL